jgi:hypothetical protein
MLRRHGEEAIARRRVSQEAAEAFGARNGRREEGESAAGSLADRMSRDEGEYRLHGMSRANCIATSMRDLQIG